MKLFNRSLSSIFWDLWCIISIVGIWPRYIEPNLLNVTNVPVKIPRLDPELQGFKILQFSDLHFHRKMSACFLKRIREKIKFLKPDLIAFTGDFLCYGKLQDERLFKNFINDFSAPYGCFAILGNHDYQDAVSINEQGDYDVIEKNSPPILKGFKRLFTTTCLTKKVTQRALAVPLNSALLDALKDSPFKLLHNATVQVKLKNATLNVTGLGEYMLGRFQPKIAFQSYHPSNPGVVLAHNPDTIPSLLDFPGDLILCGHTHGGQVNLPWMWKKFTILENMQFKKGQKKFGDRTAYISRGIGSVLPFRWFSPPEIVLYTLEAT